MFVRRSGQITTYCSTNKEFWWPQKSDIVSNISTALVHEQAIRLGSLLSGAEKSITASLRKLKLLLRGVDHGAKVGYVNGDVG